jgi:hypothetical protein
VKWSNAPAGRGVLVRHRPAEGESSLFLDACEGPRRGSLHWIAGGVNLLPMLAEAGSGPPMRNAVELLTADPNACPGCPGEPARQRVGESALECRLVVAQGPCGARYERRLLVVRGEAEDWPYVVVWDRLNGLAVGSQLCLIGPAGTRLSVDGARLSFDLPLNQSRAESGGGAAEPDVSHQVVSGLGVSFAQPVSPSVYQGLVAGSPVALIRQGPSLDCLWLAHPLQPGRAPLSLESTGEGWRVARLGSSADQPPEAWEDRLTCDARGQWSLQRRLGRGELRTLL